MRQILQFNAINHPENSLKKPEKAPMHHRRILYYILSWKDEQQKYEGVNFNTIFFSCAIIVLVLIFGSVVKSHFSPGNGHANDNQDFDFNGERNVMDELPPSYSELFGESN